MPRYLANCSMLFTELPLLRRPAAAKGAGFEAIEFWWPFATPVGGVALEYRPATTTEESLAWLRRGDLEEER
jgi:hydroxypyruvate isomerase